MLVEFLNGTVQTQATTEPQQDQQQERWSLREDTLYVFTVFIIKGKS